MHRYPVCCANSSNLFMVELIKSLWQILFTCISLVLVKTLHFLPKVMYIRNFPDFKFDFRLLMWGSGSCNVSNRSTINCNTFTCIDPPEKVVSSIVKWNWSFKIFNKIEICRNSRNMIELLCDPSCVVGVVSFNLLAESSTLADVL